MADKKLNDLTAASDGAYVYAEDASGNQIKISKADLASVVAGFIEYQPHLLADDYTDMNNYLGVVNKVTTYRFVDSAVPANLPETITTSRFFLEVGNIADSYVYQKLTLPYSQKVYYRFYVSKQWQEWIEVI